MTFGGALEALFEGRAVYREESDEEYLELREPDEVFSVPYIVCVTPKHTEPWNPTQADVLSDDWHIIDLEEEPSPN